MLVILLLASSAVSVAAVGYGCGVAGKRNVVLTTALSLLIAGVLWAIIDMDHPRRGLIQAGQQPMLDLQKSMASRGRRDDRLLSLAQWSDGAPSIARHE